MVAKMATKPLTTQTTPADNKFVDDRLRPTSEMHLMVGGPYIHDAELQRYGHTAIRIISKGSDTTYDFGRYGRVTGDFGAEGEGILRVWSSFSPYISGENALGRKTTAFVYAIFDHQAKAVTDYYNEIIATAKKRPELERQRAALKVYQLGPNYHALGYNCTTLSMDGARHAIPNIEAGSRTFIRPEAVLTFAERMAMKTVGGGTPSRLFLPANLQEFLSSKPAVKPTRVETYGGAK
ncbi:hypothetical protein ACVNIS_16855 [Sphaerotilaceae bacterium SBD11-9]